MSPVFVSDNAEGRFSASKPRRANLASTSHSHPEKNISSGEATRGGGCAAAEEKLIARSSRPLVCGTSVWQVRCSVLAKTNKLINLKKTHWLRGGDDTVCILPGCGSVVSVHVADYLFHYSVD